MTLNPAENQTPETQKRTINRGPLELLLGAAIFVTGVLLTVNTFSSKSGERLADQIRNASQSFVLEEVQPADQLLALMREPEQRAAFVPSTAEGPRKGLICAETADGEMKLFRFMTMYGRESIVPVAMTEEVAAYVPAFCEDVFARVE